MSPSHDPGATPNNDFPRLSPSNHAITSPAEDRYNCIGWAVGDGQNWWEPGHYWPAPFDLPTYQMANLVRVYESGGFEQFAPTGPAEGYEVVAVYTNAEGEYTHAARRLLNGKWASKLGAWEDIEHDTPDDVAGGTYGEVCGFMRRPLPPP